MAIATRRQRTLFLWLARLALFAYAFQMTAVDHWHKDMNSVVGDTGKSSHSYHCHGDVSGCAEQGGIATDLSNVELAVLPPAVLTVALPAALLAPEQAYVANADEPPRNA